MLLTPWFFKKKLCPVDTHGKGETLRTEKETSGIGAEFGPLLCSKYAIFSCLRQL